ncbi:MAG: hypothetical protein FWF12_07515 [Betaproteobacteria bacterium]|nr:hypothetical protein [Betaproteobacteria bacterium]
MSQDNRDVINEDDGIQTTFDTGFEQAVIEDDGAQTTFDTGFEQAAVES